MIAETPVFVDNSGTRTFDWKFPGGWRFTAVGFRVWASMVFSSGVVRVLAFAHQLEGSEEALWRT